MTSLLRPPDRVHSNPWPDLDPGLAVAVPEPDAPGEPRLPLADWLLAQAGWYRCQGTSLALWLAVEIQRRADLARALHAATPEQYDDRVEALEWDREYRSDCYDALPPIDYAEF